MLLHQTKVRSTNPSGLFKRNEMKYDLNNTAYIYNTDEDMYNAYYNVDDEDDEDENVMYQRKQVSLLQEILAIRNKN